MFPLIAPDGTTKDKVPSVEEYEDVGAVILPGKPGKLTCGTSPANVPMLFSATFTTVPMGPDVGLKFKMEKISGPVTGRFRTGETTGVERPGNSACAWSHSSGAGYPAVNDVTTRVKVLLPESIIGPNTLLRSRRGEPLG
jgi:hypothetical protein